MSDDIIERLGDFWPDNPANRKLIADSMREIERLRAERDALRALFLPIAKECARELKLGTMEALLSCPDDLTTTGSGAHRLAHLVVQWDVERKRRAEVEQLGAEVQRRLRELVLFCDFRYPVGPVGTSALAIALKERDEAQDEIARLHCERARKALEDAP